MRPKWNASIESMYEDIASSIKSVVFLEKMSRYHKLQKIFNIVKYIILFTGD